MISFNQVLSVASPKIFVRGSDNFFENKKGYLLCDFRLQSVKQVIWYKDDIQLDSALKDSSFNDQSTIIFFEKLNKKYHYGSYSCAILMADGNILQSSNSVKLEIIGKIKYRHELNNNLLNKSNLRKLR